jgi:hypothetical protein
MRSYAKLWRPRETAAAYATRKTAHSEIGTLWLEFLDPTSPALRGYGAGEVSAGSAVARTRWPTDVLSRDVLEVMEGPHAGEKWKVEGSPSTADNVVVTLQLQPFNGALP